MVDLSIAMWLFTRGYPQRWIVYLHPKGYAEWNTGGKGNTSDRPTKGHRIQPTFNQSSVNLVGREDAEAARQRQERIRPPAPPGSPRLKARGSVAPSLRAEPASSGAASSLAAPAAAEPAPDTTEATASSSGAVIPEEPAQQENKPEENQPDPYVEPTAK